MPGKGADVRSAILASLLVAAAICLPGPSHAAEPAAEECPFSLTEAIAAAEQQLVHLYEVRGTMKAVETSMPPGELVDALETYLGFGQHASETDRSGLLFYLSQDDVVCLMFARHTDGLHRVPHMVRMSPVAFDWLRLPLAPAELHALIEDRMVRFMRHGAERVRAPVPRSDFARRQLRGAASLVADRPSAESHAELLSTLDEALIPRGIVADIEALTSLSVVPVLNLGRVPFAALDPDRDGRPLIDTVVVNVEPSMQGVFGHNIYGWEPAAPAAPVIVGDPDATGDPDWSLPRLPGAAAEAAAVAARWGVSPWPYEEATPQKLVDAIGEADYIHIAAHGIASIEEPMDNSFLALTGGRLTARRIQELNLTGMPIVVLSACQSALGGPLEAGIIGVARSFVIAGAIGVVASLWNVEDEATSWIMQRFAELLLETTPGDALRRAQIEARDKWPSPRIWAAFINYGARIVAMP